ncbi:MAG: glycosyltransferase family 2 protein, partial [Puniceicoccaceae bacterium]
LDERSAYFVPNRIFFLGKWIKHCTQYPYPQVRLIKLGEVRFAKSGHGQREEAAKRGLGYIQIPYDHFNFSHGVEDWIAKHNRYSGKEAEGLSDLRLEPVKNVFSKDPIQRKRALKSYFARMPGRPLLKFCYLYFWKRGFLDGYPGLVYCRLQMLYESMISLKTVEKKWIQKREIPD